MANSEWHTFVIPIGTSILGIVGGYYFALHRAKIKRLHTFRQEMAELRAKVADVNDDDLTSFQSTTRSAVLALCARIREDIYGGVIQKFDRACSDYCELHKREKERGIEFISFLMKYGTHTMSGEEIRPPEPSDTRTRKMKMTDALQELYECAR